MAAKAGDQILERIVTDRQASRLSGLSGVAAEELSGLRLADINDRLSDLLPVEFSWWRRICGTVVKRDPMTGELLPVPGATVEVQDTDCSFLTYSPGGGLIWIYPGLCTSETIATTVTDECGQFCVWVPRWEIDWILKWRKERICFPLERPRIIDFIDPTIIDPPGPVFDPGWIDPVPEIRLRDEIGDRFGPGVAERVALVQPAAEIGSSGSAFNRMLEEPAPSFAPPRPQGEPKEVVGYTPDPLGPVDWDHWIGPFIACKDVFVPEWSASFDVPDITFRVTQEIAGTDVVIYTEGLFDVRWDDSGSSGVVLEASPAARAVETCHGPEVDCEDVPAIVAASLMPLTPGYHDDATGFGLRVNRPSVNGETQPGFPLLEDAESPIADRLDLFGCAHIDGATHYRLLYSYEGGPQQPLTGFSWPGRRASDGAVITITPDSDGWVQLQDLMEPWNHLLTAWPTQRSSFGNGQYEVWLEAGAPGGSSNQISSSHTFTVDNSYPHWDTFAVQYRVGAGLWTALDLGDCPKIFRGPTDQIEIRLTWQASADHLRNAIVGFSGCSMSSQPSALTGTATRRWWWQESVGSKTTTGVRLAEWTIDPSDDAGCYTLSGSAYGRAYNPAVPGLDLSNDYFGFENRRRVHKREAISIVDGSP